MKKILPALLLALAVLAYPSLPALADSITWADSDLSISADLTADLETYLLANPPEGTSGTIYGLLNLDAVTGGWMISLANLTNLDPPYTGWDLETNGYWMGAVECLGADPDWTCNLYEPEPIVGGGEGAGYIRFPFKAGTNAQYGTGSYTSCEIARGIQAYYGPHCGSASMPESWAVDFVGTLTGGSNIMPPEVYAAEAGTVIAVCPGAHNMAIKLQGTHTFYYFHLMPNTQVEVGDTYMAGEYMGALALGSFNDTPCGAASQSTNTYHLHFAFFADDGYFSIGGCNLNISTGRWVCGTEQIGVGGLLSNGGYNVNPDDPEDPFYYTEVMGGESMWDGVVGMAMTMADDVASNLTQHADMGLEAAASTATAYVLDLLAFTTSLQLVYLVPAFVFMGIILSIEVIRWVLVAIRWILQFIPTMG